MTSLTFDQDPIDLAVKTLLESIDNLTIFVDGAVSDVDNNAKTVGAPLPYAVLGLAMPFDTNLRVSGRGSSVSQFTLQTVHRYNDGCKDVARAVRGFLDGQPVTAGGREYWVRLADPTAPITVLRDDTWARPDGSPLFYTSDRYSVL